MREDPISVLFGKGVRYFSWHTHFKFYFFGVRVLTWASMMDEDGVSHARMFIREREDEYDETCFSPLRSCFFVFYDHVYFLPYEPLSAVG